MALWSTDTKTHTGSISQGWKKRKRWRRTSRKCPRWESVTDSDVQSFVDLMEIRRKRVTARRLSVCVCVLLLNMQHSFESSKIQIHLCFTSRHTHTNTHTCKLEERVNKKNCSFI